MNLKNFKVLDQDEENYHIGHPNGNKMVIKKSSLSEKAHELINQISDVKHFDNGGMVPEAIVEEQPVIEDVPIIAERAPASIPVEAVPAPVKDPVLKAKDDQNKSYKDQKSANYALANAIGKQGSDTSKAIEETVQEVQKLPTQKQLFDQSKAKDDALYKAYQEKKIDPDHYWNDKSTGSKISAGIGMILSGFGSGVTGQSNLALKFIDDAINRDIEAQKADQSKKMNLWKMNREALGSEMAANLATENQYYTKLKFKIDQAAANAMSPIAKAQAMQQNALIDQKITDNRLKMAVLYPTQESTGGATAGTEQAYNNHMRGLQIVAPEVYKDEADKYIPGIGVAKIKPTDKDRSTITSAKNIKDDLTELQALATQGMTAPGTTANALNKNKIAAVQLKMKEAYQLGVLSSSDLEMLDKLVADPGAFFTDKSIKQLESTKKSMEGIENSIYKKVGLTPFRKEKVKVSNGQKSLMIDSKDIAAAAKDGYSVVQ